MLRLRIVALLKDGERKRTILRALAGGEEHLRPVLKVLVQDGMIFSFRRHDGVHYDLVHR